MAGLFFRSTKYACSVAVLAILFSAEGISATPNYTPKFSVQCPTMPVLKPLASLLSYDDNPVDFYQIKIQDFHKKLFPEGLIPNYSQTNLIGYDGMFPGPTFRQKRGRESVVRFINNSTQENVAVHLHGSPTLAPFDGWANDTILTGQYKDYYYPNFESGRALWYHDHAHKETKKNVALGQAGFYIIEDDEEDHLDLPKGKYDIPLLLSSKYYNNETGQINVTAVPDSIEVNGQLYPFIEVQPRKYRFRFLNAAPTTTYSLQLFEGSGTSTPIALNVIGSDCGLISHPISTDSLRIAMGERYEVVIDFAKYRGKTLTLRNMESDATTENLQYVLQFRVGTRVTSLSNNVLPEKLRDVEVYGSPNTGPRNFTFVRNDNGVFTINNQTFSSARILANPPRGTTEIWNLKHGQNLGHLHPVHLHLVDFQILSRRNWTTNQVFPLSSYEAASLKDVVIVNPGELVQVLAKFTPWEGLYMFHCHNLEHEDGEMMSIFNVTELKGLGYPETTKFVNPMDERWRPQVYPGYTDLREIRASVLPKFKALKAYDNIGDLDKALDQYWAKTKGTTQETR